MKTDINIIIFLLAVVIFLILLLVGFIILILFLYQKRQNSFLKEIEFVKLSFDKELFKAQLEVQEQTFQYISQEIHDNVGQSISLAKLQLNTVNFENPESGKILIETSTSLLTRVLEDLRNLSKSLSAEIIKQGGLINAIEIQAEQLRRTGIYYVSFNVSGNCIYLHDQKEIILFRILQEVLNNIVKHANAGNISISLNYMNEELIMTIEDNGNGFDIAQTMQPGEKKINAGLRNIMNRAKLIDSHMDIQSEIGKGTRINIITPIKNS